MGGYVYAAEIDGMLKIGATADVEKRIVFLKNQCKASRAMVLFSAYFENHYRIETLIHQHLAEKYGTLKDREWYDISHPILENLPSLCIRFSEETSFRPLSDDVYSHGIETTRQAMAAISEIAKLTGWNDSEIARRASVNRSTISRIRSCSMKFPGYDTRMALSNCLVYARGIKQ